MSAKYVCHPIFYISAVNMSKILKTFIFGVLVGCNSVLSDHWILTSTHFADIDKLQLWYMCICAFVALSAPPTSSSMPLEWKKKSLLFRLFFAKEDCQEKQCHRSQTDFINVFIHMFVLYTCVCLCCDCACLCQFVCLIHVFCMRAWVCVWIARVFVRVCVFCQLCLCCVACACVFLYMRVSLYLHKQI